MINFKATNFYKDGVLIKKAHPSSDGLNTIEAVSMASILAGIEFAICRLAHVYKINGHIVIETVDSMLYIKFNITPPESIQPIDDEIAKIYTVQRK